MKLNQSISTNNDDYEYDYDDAGDDDDDKCEVVNQCNAMYWI
jgi:hypothetical protein